MKITKTRLQQIIKEEIAAIREEEDLAKELDKDMEDLMNSELFKHAAVVDKENAEKMIKRALKRTTFYGGKKRFYEEMLVKVLDRTDPALQQRLADAAEMDVVDWAEKLSAWATGGGDFDDDDDYDL